MSKLKKIIGIVMTFILCMATFSSSFNFSNAVENIPKLVPVLDEETQTEVLPFPVTIRDFRADYVVFEPDWTEYNGQHLWMGSGMVSETIGEDRLPVFNNYVSTTLAGYLEANKESIIQNANNYNGNEYAKINDIGLSSTEYVNLVLSYLFKDKRELNTRDESAITSIPLTKNSDGLYEYDSLDNGFFPMDRKGFDKGVNEENYSHNYHFTLESHTQFWLGNDENELTFKFSGDDDVWVYIDNKLVIDLGGIHTEQGQLIKIKKVGNAYKVYTQGMNNENEAIGEETYKFDLSGESWYNFDFFYMERHTSESNLRISTNMEFKPQLNVSKNAYTIDGNREIPIDEEDVVYLNEILYYSLEIKNMGNVDLNSVSIEDEKLGILIDSSGVKKKGTSGNYESYTPTNISISLNGQSINLDTLKSKLNTLKAGDIIIIKSTDFLKHTVTQSEVTAGEAKNTVNVTATFNRYDNQQTHITKYDSETVKVGKIDVDIVKSVYQVNGKNVLSPNVYKSLKPGDKVTFKFKISNKTKMSTTKELLELSSLSIEDTLNNNYETPEWIYTRDGELFNGENFTLGAGESITVITSEWEVPTPHVNQSYDVKNAVVLSRNNIELDSSSVDLKIARPSLRILKNVVDANKQPVDDNTGFTIFVKGNDGTQYNVKLNSKEQCTLENLKYGVTYTISELSVMNYELQGMTIDTQEGGDVASKTTVKPSGYNSLGVTMDPATDNILVRVNNVRSNDKWFSDTSITENEITYTNK